MNMKGEAGFHVIPLAEEISGMGPEEAKSVVGIRIKRGRKAAGLTAKELGEKLNPPMTQSAISSWERGRTTPSAEMRDQVEAILGDSLKHIDLSGPRIEYYVIDLDKSPVRKEAEEILFRTVKELSIEGIEHLTEYAEFLKQKHPAPKTGNTAIYSKEE